MTGLVPQNAKLGTGNINHNNERKEKLESSDSDEDSEFIKDKPLKLQMKKRKIILIYKKQESFGQKYAWLVCAYYADEINSAVVHSAWTSTFFKRH